MALSDQAPATGGSGRISSSQFTWGCAAGAIVTAALAIIAPLFTLWRQTSPKGSGAEYGGWGHVRPFGPHTSSSVGGHDTVYGIVFAIGAVLLLCGAVLLLRASRSGVGEVVTAAGSALLLGVSSTVLLDGLARISYNNSMFHFHFAPAFWMFMAVGVLSFALATAVSLAILRRSRLMP